MIDFDSDESHLLLNPRLSDDDRRQLQRLHDGAPRLDGHVWLSTSGSTGGLKLVALSKKAILASAAAVNRRLDVRGGETWCCVLPPFHVGGLGIWARAAVSGGRVVAMDWEPARFAAECERAQFSSLVPAQVVDLIRMNRRAPRAIRAIVVGGGVLSADAYRTGCKLGWPLLPSYGMTECASQIATAIAGSPELVLLDHLEVRREADGRLSFAGASLFTGYAMFIDEEPRFVDPKTDGWFISEDLGEVHDRTLIIEGRAGEVIKIGGELVSVSRLDQILSDVLRSTRDVDAGLVVVPDERLGAVLHLAVAGEIGEIQRIFNERVAPFERVREVHRVRRIPRSPLGKLMRHELAKDLSKNRE